MATKYILKYMEEIIKSTNVLQENNKKINNGNILFAYRGEAKDYGDTKLMPSLFRNTEYVSKEKYLFELLGDYNIIGVDHKRYIEKSIEAQHYIEISRALDISFSVLPALYFSCHSHLENDGLMYVFGFPKHFSPHSKYIEDVYKDILEGGFIVYDKNFRVMTHSRYNERISAQSGGFIFFPGKKFCPINKLYYDEIIIKAEHKKYILQELQDYFDINKAKLFPDKINEAQIVKKIFDETKIYDELNYVNMENEINYYFDRIDYELEMLRIVKGISDQSFLRILRKEKEDFFYYLDRMEEHEKKHASCESDKLIIEKKYNELYKEIENRFEKLKRSK